MILYKYVPPTRVDVLESRHIRFTPPGAFNDPWEALPRVTRILRSGEVDRAVANTLDEARQAGSWKEIAAGAAEDVLREAEAGGQRLSGGQRTILRELMTSPWMEDALATSLDPLAHVVFGLNLPGLRDRVSRSVFEALDERVGILSLSAVPDDLLMWSHYADSHRGFVLGFDSEDRFFDQRPDASDRIRFVKPVSYESKRPSFEGFSFDPNLDEMEQFAGVALFTKPDVWRYEREWRLVLPLASASRVEDGGQGVVRLFEYPRECLRTVVLGLRTAESMRERVRNALGRDYPHAELRQAELDPEEYKLRLESVAAS